MMTATYVGPNPGVSALREAKFTIGDVVRHRLFPFRGVIFDVDPVFANTEDWWLSIPESMRPDKDQPFYHLLAENEDGHYEAYVSEGNLLPDAENGAVGHPDTVDIFEGFDGQRYALKSGGFVQN
ncbi:MAG: DNA-binding protein [Oceanicaulis sp.]|uniref:heat shock protein HspQ n=1 Tax=Oceanicaulis TaxID=153232 RepID=UPI000685DC8B|nr:heat shock protein HspQ [Oceanicaulis sp. UBA2681]MAP48625.1 DNA-binding protein [Oceanicaulis sp.]